MHTSIVYIFACFIWEWEHFLFYSIRWQVWLMTDLIYDLFADKQNQYKYRYTFNACLRIRFGSKQETWQTWANMSPKHTENNKLQDIVGQTLNTGSNVMIVMPVTFPRSPCCDPVWIYLLLLLILGNAKQNNFRFNFPVVVMVGSPTDIDTGG